MKENSKMLKAKKKQQSVQMKNRKVIYSAVNKTYLQPIDLLDSFTFDADCNIAFH